MKPIRISCVLAALSAVLLAQTPATTRPRPRPAQTTSQTTSATGSQTTRVTLPAGTPLEVRVNENLSSESSQQGERFTGTLTSDVVDPNTNRVVIPRGAEVTGRVLSATPSGRLSNAGELQLTLNTVRYGTSVTNLSVEPFVVKGESHTRSNTTKIGGGAALGAIIGAIAGGGKGAAIGAGVGGAAGAGTAAATGKRPAEVKPEALLKFLTTNDMAMTPAAQTQSSTTSAENTNTAGGWPDASPPAASGSSNSGAAGTSPQQTNESSDAPPVMHRRDGSVAASDNSVGAASTRNTTTTGTTTTGNTTTGTGTTIGAGSGTVYGTSNPPGSTTTGTTTTSGSQTAGQGSGVYGTSSTVGAASVPDQRLFSARDRRVVNQCVRDNAASLPPASIRRTAGGPGYQRGTMLPADVQRQLRSLPLQCDRELPALSNDLERVVYGGQVMLIDSSHRVIDVFDLVQ